jgi:hypothetical protein
VRDFHSICPHVFCHETLSAEVVDSRLRFFGRAKDDSLQTRAWGGVDAGWDESRWESLGGGFIGPPSAAGWSSQEKERVDVFAVDADKQLQGARMGADGRTDGWTPHNMSTQARPALCATESQTDVFVVDATNHKIKHGWRLADSDTFTLDAGWGGAVSSQTAASGVGVACGPAGPEAIIVYDRGDWSVRYSVRGDDGTYAAWVALGGEFVGDPVVVASATDPGRFDFFGVGADKKLYHFSRAAGGAASPLESVGGSLASAPAVAAPAAGVLDVVATSTQGRVVHVRFDGARWGGEWVDIGVSSNSAPVVRMDWGREGEKTTTVGVLGMDGEVLLAEWPTAGDADWKALAWDAWESGGGRFASDFGDYFGQ